MDYDLEETCSCNRRAGTRLHGTAPARADFAIVKFNSGYCRIWPDTAVAPPDGTFIWWVWGYHRYYSLPTLAVAEHKLHTAVARHLCSHY